MEVIQGPGERQLNKPQTEHAEMTMTRCTYGSQHAEHVCTSRRHVKGCVEQKTLSLCWNKTG